MSRFPRCHPRTPEGTNTISYPTSHVSRTRSVQHASLIYRKAAAMTSYPRSSVATYPFPSPLLSTINPYRHRYPPSPSPSPSPYHSHTPNQQSQDQAFAPVDPLPSPTYRRSIHKPHPHSHFEPPLLALACYLFPGSGSGAVPIRVWPPVPSRFVLGCALLGWVGLSLNHLRIRMAQAQIGA
jgi:hypothetical protein